MTKIRKMTTKRNTFRELRIENLELRRKFKLMTNKRNKLALQVQEARQDLNEIDKSARVLRDETNKLRNHCENLRHEGARATKEKAEFNQALSDALARIDQLGTHIKQADKNMTNVRKDQQAAMMMALVATSLLVTTFIEDIGDEFARRATELGQGLTLKVGTPGYELFSQAIAITVRRYCSTDSKNLEQE